MDVGTRTIIAAAALAAAAAPAALADPIPLSHLIATRGPMVAGDTRITFNSFESRFFDPDDIMVVIVDRGDGGQGFRLEHAWRDVTAGDDSPSDFTLLFEAEAMNGRRIRGDRVAIEAAADEDFSYVHLNDHAFNGRPLRHRALSVHAEDGPGPHLVEELHDYGGEGEERLGLAQDGWFVAMSGGFATASAIERTFVVTPLPSAATLGLAGLAAVAARRRTRA